MNNDNTIVHVSSVRDGSVFAHDAGPACKVGRCGGEAERPYDELSIRTTEMGRFYELAPDGTCEVDPGELD